MWYHCCLFFNILYTMDNRDQNDTFYKSKPFQDVFNLSRQSLLLKADPPLYTVMAVSDHCLSITRNAREKVLGKPLFEAYPGDTNDSLDQKIVQDSFQRVIDTGKNDILPVFKYEIYSEEENKAHTLYWSNVNEPVFDENGKVCYLINTTENVTDQMLISQTRQKNQELEEQIAAQNVVLEDRQHLFQNLIEQAPVAIALMSGPDFIIEVCNEKVLEIWGRTKEQVLGLPAFKAMPEARGQGFEELLSEVMHTGKRIVINEMQANLVRNGKMETAWVNFTYEPIRDRYGMINSVVVVCTEVTEQVNNRLKLEQLSREKLNKSEQILTTAINSANLGTWYVDLDTGDLLSSSRLKELFGLEPGDTMTVESAMSQIPEEQRQRVSKAIDHAINHGIPFDMEYQVMGKHDHVSRWVKCMGRRYAANGENSACFAGTMLDITERKELQRRKDDFISIASHELKTPITSLNASLQFISKMNKDTGTLSKVIELASASMHRVSSLIDDLLNAAHMQDQIVTLNTSNFSVQTLIDNAVNRFKLLEKSKLRIHGDLNLIVYADQYRIEQVIINFLNNAVKYAYKSDEITLTAERNSGNEIKISVRDQGPGISQEKTKYLFERYYRTDHDATQYAGLGLGLYISAKIIEKHGGRIGVDSILGEGSTFWFTLPV